MTWRDVEPSRGRQRDGVLGTESRVLLSGPHLEGMGGIVNFNALLLECCDARLFKLHYFPIGRQPRGWLRSGPGRVIDVVLNPLRFTFQVIRARPTLIHLNPSLSRTSLPEPLIQLLIARLLRIPVLVCFHGWDHDLSKAMAQFHSAGAVLRLLLHCANHFLVVAREQQTALVQAGFAKSSITVTSVMTRVPPPRDTRPTAHGPKAPFRVMWASRMERDKGIWLMLEAAIILLQKHPGVYLEFVLAGDGPEFEAIKAYVALHGLQRHVVLPGYVRGEAKTALFASSDLFVFPSSWKEGFPTVVVEALAFGLPVIYTPVGALADVLTAEHGISIPLDRLSSECVADCIWELYCMPERRFAMAQKGSSLVRERFAVEVVCEQISSVYRQLIAAR